MTGRTDTERRCARLALSQTELAHALDPVLSAAAIDRIEPVQRGKVNSNWCVHTGGRPAFVLRVFARDASACAREAAIAAQLADTLPVPRIRHADPAGERIGHPYLVADWIAGTPLDDYLAQPDDAAGAIGRHLGELLAELATMEFATAGPIVAGPDAALATEPWDFDFLTDDILPMVAFARHVLAGPARHRLGDDLARDLLALLDLETPRLAAAADPPVLVHSDCNPTNLLVDPVSGQVVALLDWEWAHAGMRGHDLGNVLRNAPDYPPAFTAGVLAGIGAARGTWATARLIDTTAHIEFLSHPHLASRHDPARRQIADTVRNWGAWLAR